ncbi:MAG: VWA domain-containing protein [Acidimicrobiales bacterium]
MTFLSPERLWLLVAVVALAAAYVVLQGRRKQYTMRFTNLDLLGAVAPKRPGWRRHVPALFFVLAIASLVVGFAKPVAEQQVPRERATVVMAIDVSLSMMADDVDPSRIDAAKAAATSFIDIVPPQLNVALVAFNGSATVKVPPTTDRTRLRDAIANLELGERTAIGEAIFASLDAVKAVPAQAEGTAPAHIVVMSDGDTTIGRPNSVAAKKAKELGIPVSTIAFGTDAGEIVDPSTGEVTSVAVDRDALSGIAEDTGGSFFEAASEGELSEVYANIGTQVGYTTEQTEVSTVFIGGALALLSLTSVLSLVWFSRLP